MLATLSIENSRKKRNLYWIPYILEHESLGQRHFSNRSSYPVYNAIKFTIVVQKKKKKKRFARCHVDRCTHDFLIFSVVSRKHCRYINVQCSYRNSKYNIRINNLMYLCRNPQIVTISMLDQVIVIIIYAYSQ